MELLAFRSFYSEYIYGTCSIPYEKNTDLPNYATDFVSVMSYFVIQ